MTVRLRAHHLLCLPTYVGRGYSPAFVANCDGVVTRLGGGEDILLVSGPDDICAPLLDGAAPHCLRPGVAVRDQRAAAALASLLGRDLRDGARLALDPATLGAMRTAFGRGTTRAACTGCEWSGLCTGVAAAGFAAARLRLPRG